ncbi:hypothetical protein OSTOST_08564 [Ostertagia ostertagi]
MVSFVLVEAESQDVLMNLIQYLTGNSLKFTVATDIRRLFARTYLDVDGNCAGDVSSSSVDAGLHHRSDLNISSAVPSQFNGVMPNLFGMMAKTEPESQFGRWLSQSTSSQEHVPQNPILINPKAEEPEKKEKLREVACQFKEEVAEQSLEESQESTCRQKRTLEIVDKPAGKRIRKNCHGCYQRLSFNSGRDEARKYVTRLCGKRITMRRCNLRHHAAVVHSGIERYVCRCGYSTVHRNTIIRHMLKHASVESEKDYEFTDMLTPAEAEQIEKLAEECFREYRIVPRSTEEADDLVRSIENIASGVDTHAGELDGPVQELDDHGQELSAHGSRQNDVTTLRLFFWCGPSDRMRCAL